MVARISELKLPVGHDRKALEQEICRILHIRQVRLMTSECNSDTGNPDPGGKPQIPEYEILRRSIDARKKPDLYYVYTVDVHLAHAQAAVKKLRNRHVTAAEPKEYVFPYSFTVTSGEHKNNVLPPQMTREADRQADRPVVIGSGPAGLFCALMLARAGLRPIILERGESVEKRTESVRRFWETGDLNPASNVQFGEGGAGTFSDGKLNTLIRDTDGKIRFVLREFVNAGADPSILWSHKPHIGTDVLVRVVKHMREEIIRLGGEVRFETCLTGIRPADASGETPGGIYSSTFFDESHPDTFSGNCRRDCAASAQQGKESTVSNKDCYILELNNGEKFLRTHQLVLAIGHSARDTFQMLYDADCSMEAKAFAVGLRVQHSQAMINQAMYGVQNCTENCLKNPAESDSKIQTGQLSKSASDPGSHGRNQDCDNDTDSLQELGAAPYKLTHKCENGRGVYSFCMCPGGYVVNASSEAGMTAVNGMSYSNRGSRNANSAIVVTVTPEDYQRFTRKDAEHSGEGGRHNFEYDLSHSSGDSMEANGASDPEAVWMNPVDRHTRASQAVGALDGIAFQRQLERAAFQCGQGMIPIQRFEDYCMNRPSEAPGELMPENKGQWMMTNLRSILPEDLNASIIEGMRAFGCRIPEFGAPDVLLAGVESRTSSPVRILRGADCQSVSHPGIFPCGEGAGYAGGITSAAVDGIRVAEAVCRSYAASMTGTS